MKGPGVVSARLKKVSLCARGTAPRAGTVSAAAGGAAFLAVSLFGAALLGAALGSAAILAVSLSGAALGSAALSGAALGSAALLAVSLSGAALGGGVDCFL